MKGALEFYTLLVIFMFTSLLGIQIVNGFVGIQYIHLQTEATVSIIEEYDTYNNDVRRIINNRRVCDRCQIDVEYRNKIAYVTVSSNISIPILKWTKNIAFTSIPNI